MIANAKSPTTGSGVFRYAQDKPIKWKELSEEVSISWKFHGAKPDAALSKRMHLLEDALEDLCWGADSRLVLVMTVSGYREWCFYTRDYTTFMKELNAKLSKHDRFPIEIQHSHDPEWKYWHSFIDRIREKGEANKALQSDCAEPSSLGPVERFDAAPRRR